MNVPRTIPAGPMGLDAILPLIREVGSLRERGEYQAAAELEERIRQPITVAGRTLAPLDGSAWQWYLHDDRLVIMLSTTGSEWQATLSASGVPCSGVGISAGGWGPTIAAALSDAQERYQAAIADTLLRMGGLLREVGQ